MKVITGKGVFTGFYEWGPGWTKDGAAEAWRGFWDGFNADGRWTLSAWRHAADGRFGSHYLVSTTGSVFLHPMDFTVLLREGVVSCHGIPSHIGELKEICEECAKACGGSFELGDLKTHLMES